MGWHRLAGALRTTSTLYRATRLSDFRWCRRMRPTGRAMCAMRREATNNATDAKGHIVTATDGARSRSACVPTARPRTCCTILIRAVPRSRLCAFRCPLGGRSGLGTRLWPYPSTRGTRTAAIHHESCTGLHDDGAPIIQRGQIRCTDYGRVLSVQQTPRAAWVRDAACMQRGMFLYADECARGPSLCLQNVKKGARVRAPV